MEEQTKQKTHQATQSRGTNKTENSPEEVSPPQAVHIAQQSCTQQPSRDNECVGQQIGGEEEWGVDSCPIGRSRCQVVLDGLLELNPSVSGVAVHCSVDYLLNSTQQPHQNKTDQRTLSLPSPSTTSPCSSPSSACCPPSGPSISPSAIRVLPVLPSECSSRDPAEFRSASDVLSDVTEGVFLNRYDLIVACNCTPQQVNKLFRLCRLLGKQAVVVRSAGMYVYVQLFAVPHIVLDTHTHAWHGCLRISNPFPELLPFLRKHRLLPTDTNPSTTDDSADVMLPYVALLMSALMDYNSRVLDTGGDMLSVTGEDADDGCGDLGGTDGLSSSHLRKLFPDCPVCADGESNWGFGPPRVHQQTDAHKTDRKELSSLVLTAAARSTDKWNNSRYGGEQAIDNDHYPPNVTEALDNLFKAATPYSIPSALLQALHIANQHVDLVGKEDTVDKWAVALESRELPMWICLKALRRFVVSSGYLPVSGSLPDMAADSVSYRELRELYFNKAQQDRQQVIRFVVDVVMEEIVGDAGEPLRQDVAKRLLAGDDIKCWIAADVGTVVEQMVAEGGVIDVMCKRGSAMKLLALMPSQQQPTAAACCDSVNLNCSADEEAEGLELYLCMFVVDCFLQDNNNNRAPHVCAAHIANPSTTEDAMSCCDLHRLASQWQAQRCCTGGGPPVLPPWRLLAQVALQSKLELHCVSALAGGVASQEAVKLLCRQFEPINNTFVWDGLRTLGAVVDVPGGDEDLRS
eukprot:GHVS01053217.1.p1 GENE.GHVS01053217.1~~GHVS01053217.1.p1  ORF type:complete len:832 (-),score=198.07 GHVS01053217.1:262-2496(-)